MKITLVLDLKDDDESLVKVDLVAKALVMHAACLLRERAEPYQVGPVFTALLRQETPWAHISWSVSE